MSSKSSAVFMPVLASTFAAAVVRYFSLLSDVSWRLPSLGRWAQPYPLGAPAGRPPTRLPPASLGRRPPCPCGTPEARVLRPYSPLPHVPNVDPYIRVFLSDM